MLSWGGEKPRSREEELDLMRREKAGGPGQAGGCGREGDGTGW